MDKACAPIEGGVSIIVHRAENIGWKRGEVMVRRERCERGEGVYSEDGQTCCSSAAGCDGQVVVMDEGAASKVWCS